MSTKATGKLMSAEASRESKADVQVKSPAPEAETTALMRDVIAMGFFAASYCMSGIGKGIGAPLTVSRPFSKAASIV